MVRVAPARTDCAGAVTSTTASAEVPVIAGSEQPIAIAEQIATAKRKKRLNFTVSVPEVIMALLQVANVDARLSRCAFAGGNDVGVAVSQCGDKSAGVHRCDVGVSRGPGDNSTSQNIVGGVS